MTAHAAEFFTMDKVNRLKIIQDVVVQPLFCSSFLVFSILIILIVKIYIPNPRKWLILLGSYHKKKM